MHHVLFWSILLDQEMETSSSYLVHTFYNKRTWRNGLQWLKYSPWNLGNFPFKFFFFSFLPFFQFWSNMSFNHSAPINVPTNVIKGGFLLFLSALKIHSKTNRSTFKAGVLLTILLKWRNPRRADMHPHPTLFFSNKDTSFLPPVKIATLQLSTHEPCEFPLYHRYGWSSSGPPFPIQHSLSCGWISMVSPCNIHWWVLVHCGPFPLTF